MGKTSWLKVGNRLTSPYLGAGRCVKQNCEPFFIAVHRCKSLANIFSITVDDSSWGDVLKAFLPVMHSDSQR